MSLPPSDRTKRADGRRTSELRAVLPDTAEIRDDHLFIGGVDMVELARDEGTALYVYDEQTLKDRMEEYLRAFRSRYERTDVLFASKAFLNRAVLSIVADEGLCLDVSGGGELACARSVDFPPERIYVHGNNKTPQELAEALEAGVGAIVVDSVEELERVSAMATERGIVQTILMRITPGVVADTFDAVRTGCEDSKFGFTLLDDWAFTCIRQALAMPGVHLAGLHCHIGSQIFALDPYTEAVGIMVDLMARVRDECGAVLDVLDMGGGLGVAYGAEDRPSTIDEIADVLTTALFRHCERTEFPLPRLLVEPGRSLVANAGVTLYTVGTIKDLPGIRKIVAIDGGMSDNIRTALYGANYEATIANRADEPRTEVVTIVGKHCESGDAVVVDASLQPAAVGDVVCVFGTGAYCATMASNYNGQVRPAVVFVNDGVARVTTRRETYEDLLARDLG